jgi:hypothetical protein
MRLSERRKGNMKRLSGAKWLELLAILFGSFALTLIIGASSTNETWRLVASALIDCVVNTAVLLWPVIATGLSALLFKRAQGMKNGSAPWRTCFEIAELAILKTILYLPAATQVDWVGRAIGFAGCVTGAVSLWLCVHDYPERWMASLRRAVVRLPFRKS